jgi:hypothetical protein
MNKFIVLMFLGSLLYAITSYASSETSRVFAPTFDTFKAKQTEMESIYVHVQAGLADANPQWRLPSTLHNVLITRLLELPNHTSKPADDVWKKAPVPEPLYRGVKISIRLTGHDTISDFYVFEGQVKNRHGKKITADPGRNLEYWLMGTARIKRDQLLAARVLPILSFEQCRLLSNQIVETTPRQCLLPDGNLLLETLEQPTTASLKAVDFDSCLMHGKALIQTFPRRCMAAGGRVFTEPPKVYEAPADAPLASVISSSLPAGLTTSGTALEGSLTNGHTPNLLPAVSPTKIISRTGLGLYRVSLTAPISSTVSATAVSFTAVSATVSPTLSPTLSVSNSAK